MARLLTELDKKSCSVEVTGDQGLRSLVVVWGATSRVSDGAVDSTQSRYDCATGRACSNNAECIFCERRVHDVVHDAMGGATCRCCLNRRLLSGRAKGGGNMFDQCMRRVRFTDSTYVRQSVTVHRLAFA